MTDDEEIGRTVRALREAAGMSQAQLAQYMTGAGFSFHPQTITKIEGGQRSLKLTEGLHLARIFRVSPRDLYKPGRDVVLDARVVRMVSDLRRAFSLFTEAYSKYRYAKHELASVVESGELQVETVAYQEARIALEDNSLPRDLEEDFERAVVEIGDRHLGRHLSPDQLAEMQRRRAEAEKDFAERGWARKEQPDGEHPEAP